jgi:predicted O-methyltransferase YrrM
MENRQVLDEEKWHRVVSALAGVRKDPSVPAVASLAGDATTGLVRVIAAVEPESVLELGSGHSTVTLARSAIAQLVTLDHNKYYLAQTSRRLEALGLASRVDLRHAPIRWCLRRPFFGRSYDAKAVSGMFDLVLIDGPPSREVGRLLTLPIVWPHLRVGGFAILDDANRPRLESRCVTAWGAAYGRAVRIERFPHFAKGLAVIQKVADAPAGRADAGWRASISESTRRTARAWRTRAALALSPTKRALH